MEGREHDGPRTAVGGRGDGGTDPVLMDAAPKKEGELERIEKRVHALNETLKSADARLTRLGDRLLGCMPEAEDEKGRAGAAGAVSSLEDSVLLATETANAVIYQIERLEVL